VGDFDGNGCVNDADVEIIVNGYGTRVAPYTNGDTNGDGYVDDTDIEVLVNNYGVGTCR
jgi:hypothetical protein